MPLALRHYMTGWTLNQYFALYFQSKFPDRLHIVRAEDVMADSYATLGGLGEARLGAMTSLRKPTWNGTELEEVYPWGTLRKVTPADNKATAEELSPSERDEIRAYAAIPRRIRLPELRVSGEARLIRRDRLRGRRSRPPPAERRARSHALVRPASAAWRIDAIRDDLRLHTLDLADADAVHRSGRANPPGVVFLWRYMARIPVRRRSPT
ncbi:MAG: hypothetical protein U0703_25230 [Anaerolineae bacterium]